MTSDKMFGFEDGRVPVGYAFAEDGAVVPVALEDLIAAVGREAVLVAVGAAR